MKTPVALNHDELQSLLSVAREHDLRVWTMFLLGVTHGLRVSELINLRRKDFVAGGYAGTIYLKVQRLKGSLETSQRLLTNDNPLLDEYFAVVKHIAGLKPNDLLFPRSDGEKLTRKQVWTLFRSYTALAGIAEHKRFPHVMKHTCGMTLRLSGCKLEVIQQALGHKNINSTAAYLRTSPEETDAARQRAFAILDSPISFAAVAGN